MMQTLTVEVSPRQVATVLLNRPDRGNAFDQTMLDELRDQFATLSAEEAVRVVVLRGSGRHFCTGADLAARGPPATAASGASANAPTAPADSCPPTSAVASTRSSAPIESR